MICPKCGRGKLKTLPDSLALVPGEVERRRCCNECDALFETSEVVVAWLERKPVRGRPKKAEYAA
jgi:transcriptional regulator NrdR family protein